MKIEHSRRTLSVLYKERELINLTPMWQRGVAWTRQKQALLIDSILRGMDIPKIYFRHRRMQDGAVDVVDGQQRLRAIWDFIDGEYALKHSQPLARVGSFEINGKTFAELPKALRSRLRNFKVSIALIKDAPTQDITLLFARLQLAAPLNSAELRNAILSPIRHEVDATALNHTFFDSCRISSKRMKHQDFAAHAYALVAHGDGADLKAPDLRDLYVQSTDMVPQDLADMSAKVSEALDVLADVNGYVNNRITQKWMFCDLFLFVVNNIEQNAAIDAEEMASIYREFETRRLEHVRNADVLLEGEHSQADQDLYDYIQAFRIEGGLQPNIETRAAVIERTFQGCIS